MAKISVVINTLNEEENLPKAISSVTNFADEIIVVDMQSGDSTKEVAEKLGALVFDHKKTGYVEPARNFAISKASGEWVLILDADEEVPPKLKTKLKSLIAKPKADFYRIPRKNMVFGSFLKHSRWWPDLNIRFFKKGKVSWSEVIHSVPMTTGKGIDLPAEEDLAIIHNNYSSVEQFLGRMNRYTAIQAENLIKEGHKFIWKDLISRPLSEFLSRYFAGEGYKDGLHGLALSLLQAFSEVILYLKVWQREKFLPQATTWQEVEKEFKKAGAETGWWINEVSIKGGNFLTSIPLRIKQSLTRRND
jgi:(heptosyl)LPS beta-1,4-glucosyltransferase